MRIAVDATCWHNRRGYGRHARALLRAVVRLDTKNHYTLFLDSTDPAEPMPVGCDVRLNESSVPTVEAASADGHRSLTDMARQARALSSSEFDVVLFPTIYSFVPTWGRARKLVMMHDVIADMFPKLTVPRWTSRLFWNLKVALGRMQADRLITVSNYSRDCIVKHFGTDPKRVSVVSEAADPIFRRLEDATPTEKLRELGLDGARRMVVYLGGFSPHKNLEALVAAFARTAQREGADDPMLVMVGDTHTDAFHTCFEQVSALAESLGLKERVVFTGYLDDADVVTLLNRATVLVLPSLMEGFGLPAVEAAACGCPVIATKESPLPELLGDGGLYIGPNEEAIATALERVLTDDALRARMRVQGMAAAARLTWEDAALQLISVINGNAQGKDRAA
jgi:glycosyltransferase involved in cell wall biosynthesis